MTVVGSLVRRLRPGAVYYKMSLRDSWMESRVIPDMTSEMIGLVISDEMVPHAYVMFDMGIVGWVHLPAFVVIDEV